MNWSRYKLLCDTPIYWSRWMLEQSHLLCAALAEARHLQATLAQAPLPKPSDHRGGATTDMLRLVLPPATARTLHSRILAAAAAGERTPATAVRGLGGFVEAWTEYVQFMEALSAEQLAALQQHPGPGLPDLLLPGRDS